MWYIYIVVLWRSQHQHVASLLSDLLWISFWPFEATGGRDERRAGKSFSEVARVPSGGRCTHSWWSIEAPWLLEWRVAGAFTVQREASTTTMRRWWWRRKERKDRHCFLLLHSQVDNDKGFVYGSASASLSSLSSERVNAYLVKRVGIANFCSSWQWNFIGGPI